MGKVKVLKEFGFVGQGLLEKNSVHDAAQFGAQLEPLIEAGRLERIPDEKPAKPAGGND